MISPLSHPPSFSFYISPMLLDLKGTYQRSRNSAFHRRSLRLEGPAPLGKFSCIGLSCCCNSGSSCTYLLHWPICSPCPTPPLPQAMQLLCLSTLQLILSSYPLFLFTFSLSMPSLREFNKETPHCKDHNSSPIRTSSCVQSNKQKAFASRGTSTLVSEHVCSLQYVSHTLFPVGRWAASDIISSCRV